jgi:hypothetical protein
LNGVKGVGLALEVGVRAGRLGNVAGVEAATATVAVASVLEADFEHAASARTISTRIKIRFIIFFPFLPGCTQDMLILLQENCRDHSVPISKTHYKYAHFF